MCVKPQAAQTLFVIYIRDSIALRFKPFKRMYENGSKIALNSTCSKGFKSSSTVGGAGQFAIVNLTLS